MCLKEVSFSATYLTYCLPLLAYLRRFNKSILKIRSFPERPSCITESLDHHYDIILPSNDGTLSLLTSGIFSVGTGYNSTTTPGRNCTHSLHCNSNHTHLVEIEKYWVRLLQKLLFTCIELSRWLG